jgi:hypothetical protein
MFFLMSFPFLYILNYLQSSLTVNIYAKFVYKYVSISIKIDNLLKRLQRLKQEWQKSPAGTRQTDGKNLVWFGEIEIKLATLSKTTFTYHSYSYYFMDPLLFRGV